jgi:hypothetical protein
VTHLERRRSGILGGGETETVALFERVDAAESSIAMKHVAS